MKIKYKTYFDLEYSDSLFLFIKTINSNVS